MPDTNGKAIWVTSLYGFNTRKPMVQIEVPDPVVQLDIEDALQLGQNIIAVAHGAEADTFIAEFFRQELEIDDQQAAMLLQKFRQFREAKIANPHPHMRRNQGRYGTGG
jgi:UTP-glucose-1-phosphate uridylyltransferase